MAAINIDYGRVSQNEDNSNYDVDAAVQGLISNLEGDAETEQNRLMNHDSSRSTPFKNSLPANMMVEEVSEADFARPMGHLADEEDVLLREVSIRLPRRPGRQYCGTRRCLGHMSLLTVSALLMVAAVAIINRQSEEQASKHAVLSPPNNLEVLCSHNYIHDLSNGEADCHEACAPGACCYTENGVGPNCYSGNDSVCAKYSVCLLLGTFQTTFAPGHTGHVFVGIPPSNLADVCNANTIATAAGQHTCNDLCAPSSCCFKLEEDDNCYSFGDNFESCDVYRDSCSSLGSDYGGTGGTPITRPPTSTVVPEPSATLAIVCSDVSDEELLAECSEECAPAKCCTSTDIDASCFVENEKVCARYVSCDILKQTSSVVPPAPSDLAIVCTNVMDPEYRDTCEELCKPSACCEDTCEDNPMCDDYIPCDNLRDNASEAPAMRLPPDDLDQVCKETNIQIFRADCEDSCTSASCCWSENDDDNCSITNADMCSKYAPCKTLETVPPDAPGDLQDLCADTQSVGNDLIIAGVPWLDNTPGEGPTCQKACEKAFCCVSTGNGDRELCPEYEKTRCTGYTFCSIFSPIFDILSIKDGQNTGVIPNKPNELVSACSAKLTQSQSDLGACEAACSPAKCCIEGGGADYCFEENKDTCNAYGICFVLPEVAAACSHDNLTTIDGQKQCENLCGPHSCCFEPGPGGESCWYDKWDVCVKYAPCFSLLGLNNGKLLPLLGDNEDTPKSPANSVIVASKPPDLNEKCAGILKGEAASFECRNDCKLADCCEKEGSDDCFDANEHTCSSYGICFVLPEVASACSHTRIETDAGHTACYDLCYPKSCCFTSGLDNCYDDSQKECMKYAACFTLLSFHGGELPPREGFSLGSGGNDKLLSSTHTDVGDICSLSSPEFDESMCQQECQVASCCISSGDDNCYKENEDACLSYSPCFTEASVSLSCSKVKLSSEATPLDCLDVCSPYACCFEFTDAGDTACASDKEKKCLEYVPCAIVAHLLADSP